MFLVTDCDDHGSKSTAEQHSALIYVTLATIERDALNAAPVAHMAEHAADGTECWVCCPRMGIDPHGVFDDVDLLRVAEENDLWS